MPWIWKIWDLLVLKDLGSVLLFALSVYIVWFDTKKNRGSIVEQIKKITGFIMILEAENGVGEPSSNSGLVCVFTKDVNPFYLFTLWVNCRVDVLSSSKKKGNNISQEARTTLR